MRNQEGEAALIPTHISALRVSWDVNRDLGLDVTAYHVSDRNEQMLQGAGSEIKAFTSLNTALTWQESPNVELRLVGQDLLDSSRVQGVSRTPRRQAVAVPRGVYAEIRVNY